MCAKIKIVQYCYNHRGAPLLAGSSEGRTCWGHPSPSSGLMRANFIVFFDFYNRLITNSNKNGGEPHLSKKTKIYGIITLCTKVRQNNGGIPKW